MSEPEDAPAHPATEEGFDREIHLRAIAWFGVGLVGLTGVSLLAMWLLFRLFKGAEERTDPLPSPIREASEPRVPPGPRLQERPESELIIFRAEEQALLTTYGWVDESGGVARIPIERAIELVAERGLPVEAPPAGEVQK